MDGLDTLDSRQLLQVAAGTRCPCGHMSKDHEGPAGIPGEKWGACNEDDCGCKGVIDMIENADEAV